MADYTSILEDTISPTLIFEDTPKVNEEKCDNPGVTDKGIFTVANIRTALAIAVAAINLRNTYKMAKLQEDIADRYAKMAEEARQYYYDSYRPLELQLIKEADQDPVYVRDKEKLRRGQVIISARNQFAGKVDKAMSCTGRYCTGQRAAIMNDLLTQQATAEALASGMAHRYLDAEEIARNNARFERRRSVLNIGRDIPGEAVAYADFAAGIFGSIGDQSAKAVAGIAWWAGHNNNRRETVYPQSRAPLAVKQKTYEITPPTYDVQSITPVVAYTQPEPKPDTPKIDITVSPTG